ncbi:calcium-activated potassium channel subunit beta-1 [Tiliqua scincoides]|uniref:calcium-activated potassium channel subunit beta-1 n=1 Tax=Tiliqua scincoides TaxID=71010 RepID=UPI003462A5A9
MLGKKLVMAQKRGETRALCLGLGMVACSVIMYFFIGITIMPFYKRSVWIKESVCKLMKAGIKEVHFFYNESISDENIFHYPCLDVQVNLTVLGQVVMLYHTEETIDKNPKCSYIPPNLEDYNEVQRLVETIVDSFRKAKLFPCHYDPSREETSVLYQRLYPPEKLLITFIWPTLMWIGGVLIVIMVKISQYFSLLSATQNKTGI